MEDSTESWSGGRQRSRACARVSGVGAAFSWQPPATRGQSSSLLEAGREEHPRQVPRLQARPPAGAPGSGVLLPFPGPSPTSGYSHVELRVEHLLLPLGGLLDGKVIDASPLNFQSSLGYLIQF